MVDTISAPIQIVTQTVGGNDDTWGTINTANLTKFETAIAVPATLNTLTGGSLTLSDTQSRSAILDCSGILVANQTIVVRTATKWWFVKNGTSGAFTLTVKTSAGTGVTVVQGQSAIVYCDGTNVIDLLNNNFLKAFTGTTDNVLVKTDGANGTAVQETGIVVDDNNNVSGINDQTIGGNALVTGIVGKAATSGLRIPSGTTAQRADTHTQIRFNTTLHQLEAFYDGAWQPLGFSPGDIKIWLTETAPTGWLELIGSNISRTTFAALFALWGTTFGLGDGSSTFGTPDFRGYFVRGWDHGAGADPDAASRTNRGDGTTGDHVGTKQADEFKSHTHTLQRRGPPQISYNAAFQSPATNGLEQTTTDPTGGNETRAKNISAMFCVKT